MTRRRTNREKVLVEALLDCSHPDLRSGVFSDKSAKRIASAVRSITLPDCELCNDTGWLHGCQRWTSKKMVRGTPYYSEKCKCDAAERLKRVRRKK